MLGVNLRISSRIRRALDLGEPVVALESTVITHGLPRPDNVRLAHALEADVREAGAEPATIGMLDGDLVVGLTRAEVEELDAAGAAKASTWNVAALSAARAHAGTTVATTVLAAERAGIEVFATGGIGGVHEHPYDESADLAALARHHVVTVCAGPKSILDVTATVERLESLGVPVLGYQTDRVAGFHVATTDVPAARRVDAPEDVAEIYRRHRELGLPGGVVVAKPVSEGLDPEQAGTWIERARRDAAQAGVRGKDTTPFLLGRLAELSRGATVEVNLRLLRENARLAAAIARALVTSRRLTGALP